ADVIYHAAGGSGGGLFEAAAETGDVWAIGVDSDQYNTADPSVRDVILTSMLKKVDVAVFGAIEAFVNGTLEAGVQEFDLTNDGVGFSTTGGFLTQEIIDQLEELKQRIIDGESEVPSAPCSASPAETRVGRGPGVRPGPTPVPRASGGDR